MITASPVNLALPKLFRLKIIMLFYAMAMLFLPLSGRANPNADYVLVYHPVINQAELHIIAQDYEAALEYYRQAFGAVETPFAKDLYNAAACATLLNKDKQAATYLNKLVLKGVSLEYLEKQEVFEGLHDSRHWRKFKRKYAKHRRQYKNRAELDVRADLDELYARDQYFRQAEGGLRVYGDTLRKIEAANVATLLQFIEQYGYPGEDLIGVADTLEQLPRFSIVIQRQVKPTKDHDFTPILKRAVHEGKVSPQAAAFLMDQQLGRNHYKSKVFVKVVCSNPKICQEDKELQHLNKFLVEKLNKQEEGRVNATRAKIGLESLADYRKKVLYNLSDKRFKLDYAWSIANYHVPSKEAALVLTEGMVAAE